MKNVGILPGGRVAGNFVWGILGSQVRLVLVGGELHKAMTAGLEEKKNFDYAQKTGLHPTEATLMPGHIYRKKDKTLHLFIGRVKRPGVEKVQFAFVQLPEKPNDWEGHDIDSWGNDHHTNHYKEEREASKKWDSWSWTDRCQWDWYDSKEYLHRQYPSAAAGYYHSPGNIILMTSPKFEADVGDDTVLADWLRLNEGSKHRYINGHGDDLAEVDWKKANGDIDRVWKLPLDYREHYADRQKREREHQARVTAEYMKDRAAYQKKLEWL
jgi:hypothetical protein